MSTKDRAGAISTQRIPEVYRSPAKSSLFKGLNSEVIDIFPKTVSWAKGRLSVSEFRESSIKLSRFVTENRASKMTNFLYCRAMSKRPFC